MHIVDKMFKPINLVSNENPKQNPSRFGLKAKSQKSNSVGKKLLKTQFSIFITKKHRFLANCDESVADETTGQITNGFQFGRQRRINLILSTTVSHFSKRSRAVSDFNNTIIQNVLENHKNRGRL